ncbi:MAG: DUF2817 domain-containing protein [Alphaproteobacteria bacterium]|nr:DUF2817 domain-containing protein [Alphaproteobacteria bacterium]
MTISTLFSADYSQSRQAFLAAARDAGATVVPYVNPVGTGPAGEQLATDVASLGSGNNGPALVICSGTHGIEGYCGSAIQTGLLQQRIFDAARESLSIYLVHALNPYGFAHNRRVNEDNIDLNRNFIDFTKPPQRNEDYDNLHEFLAPPKWDDRQQADIAIADYVGRHGMDKLAAAVTGGQWHHADGIFYGGQGPAWSNRTWHQIIRDHLAGHSHIAAIDLHTGLGAFGYGEPICIASSGDENGTLARQWYGDEVTVMADGSSCSAPITGALLSALTRPLAAPFLMSIALEFGTRPANVVLDALRADNWLHGQADNETPLKEDIIRAMKSAFYPDESEWREKIWLRGREITLKAIGGLMAFDQKTAD